MSSPRRPEDARVELSTPTEALVPSYLEFLDELRAAGDTVWPSRVPEPGQSAADFVARLRAKAELPPPTGPRSIVAESVYWGQADGVVVGFIALRHTLTEALASFGGHVGYEVRPCARRRGVGTAMLGRLLATQRARRIGRILITCAPDNVGSRKMIEANGGRLADIAFSKEAQRETCRYWIDLAQYT